MQQNNQTYFQRALADAHHIKWVATDYLESLVLQYPWFAKAQQLLAKKYQIEESEKFNHQLQRAALHSIDRKELFVLIEQTDIAIDNPVNIVEQKPEAALTVIAELPTIAMEQPAAIAKPFEPIVLDFKMNNQLQDTFQNKTLEPLSMIHIRVAEEIIGPIETKKTDDILATIAAAEIPAIKINLPAETDHINMEQDTNLPADSVQAPKSFNAWLHQFSKGSTINQDAALNKKTADNLKVAKALMNEFIGNDEEDSEPDDLKVNLAELMSFSMQRHDDFVTETMAKVYVQQEKYDKAIATYQKLSLLKPEKSVFFAAQIEELKNKIQ